MSPRPKDRDGAILALDALIKTLNLVEDISSITPTKAVSIAARFLRAKLSDEIADEPERVKLGLECAETCRACAAICEVLNREINEKQPGDLGQSVRDAIIRLTTVMTEIQRKASEQNNQGTGPPPLENDKGTTVPPRESGLGQVLRLSNVRRKTHRGNKSPKAKL